MQPKCHAWLAAVTVRPGKALTESTDDYKGNLSCLFCASGLQRAAYRLIKLVFSRTLATSLQSGIMPQQAFGSPS